MTIRPVRVSVVAYGASELLARTLSALGGAFPVTVIDNSSDPDVQSVSFAAGADYVDSGQNLGFGAGHNIVLRDAQQGPPRDVLLLNPDAVITPDGVQGLQAFLLEQEQVGTVTPRLVSLDGHRQREMWPFPTPGRAWLEAIGLGRFNRACDFAVGTVLLVRWELLQDHLFDERFFLYAEESDLQRTARRSGWHAALCDTVNATHIGAATSTNSAQREAFFYAGTETHVRKWHGQSGWFSFRTALVLGSAIRGVVLRGPRGSAARRRARVFLQGPRRAAGLVDS